MSDQIKIIKATDARKHRAESYYYIFKSGLLLLSTVVILLAMIGLARYSVNQVNLEVKRNQRLVIDNHNLICAIARTVNITDADIREKCDEH